MKKVWLVTVLLCAIAATPQAAHAQQQTTQGSFSITVTGHWVDLGWSAGPGAATIVGYNLYRSSAATGPWAKINPSLVDVQTFKDANVTAGETYYYVCTAIDLSGQESAHSNVAPATVPKP